MCFLVLFLRKLGFELFRFESGVFPLLLQGLLNSNSHGDGHADHGVVAGAQEAHHLNVLPDVSLTAYKTPRKLWFPGCLIFIRPGA